MEKPSPCSNSSARAEYQREPYLLFETLRAVSDGRVTLAGIVCWMGTDSRCNWPSLLAYAWTLRSARPFPSTELRISNSLPRLMPQTSIPCLGRSPQDIKSKVAFERLSL